MLYDKRWDTPKAPKVHDVWSFDGLIAWLRTMPPEQEYIFTDNYRCMIAQYLKARGWVRPYVRTYDAADRGQPPIGLPSGWNDIANNWPRTFGAALTRALAAKAAE